MSHFLERLNAFLLAHPRLVYAALLLYFFLLLCTIAFLPIFAYSH